MRTITAIFTVILLSSGIYAQNSKSAEIKVKTSSRCDMCKERIEEALAFEKGVKKSEVDVEAQVVTVTYRPSRTTPEKIRRAISMAGYDADGLTADPKAYSRLPACCKKPGDPEAGPHDR